MTQANETDLEPRSLPSPGAKFDEAVAFGAALKQRFTHIFGEQRQTVNIYAPPGWRGIVTAICCVLDDAAQAQEGISVVQIKEKYARLTVYANGLPDELRAFVERLESASMRLCQTCGSPGAPRKMRGRVATLCDRHYDEVRGKNEA